MIKIYLTMKKRAICMGINYPGTNIKLNGCVADATSMAYTANKLGVNLNDITLLIDEGRLSNGNYSIYDKLMVPTHRDVLFKYNQYNKQYTPKIKTTMPTKTNFLNELKNACQDPNVGVLFLTSASHGTYGTDKTRTESDGLTEYICTLDNNGKYNGLSSSLSDDEFIDTINSAFSKRSNIPLIIYCVIDSCHSGTVLDLDYMIDYVKDGSTKKLKFSKDNNLKKNNLNNLWIYGFTACQDSQSANENSITGMARGFGTRAFETTIASLYQNTNSNNSYTVYDIYKNMVQQIDEYDGIEIPNYNKNSQLPKLSCNKDFSVDQNKNKFMCGRFLLGESITNISKYIKSSNISVYVSDPDIIIESVVNNKMQNKDLKLNDINIKLNTNYETHKDIDYSVNDNKYSSSSENNNNNNRKNILSRMALFFNFKCC